jgi:hypothetical protein
LVHLATTFTQQFMTNNTQETVQRASPSVTNPEKLQAVRLLSPDAYEQGVKAWLTQLVNGEPSGLTRSFQNVSGQQVAYLSFPIQSIVELVSASTTGKIFARFVLTPDASGEPRVTLALFAVDSKGLRVSSYYVANEFSTAIAAPLKMHAPQVKTGPSAPNEVASVLINHWRQTWADTAVSADMFETPYGPLNGYNFEPTDFLSLFFKLTSFGTEQVRLHFVLHPYHHSTDDGQDVAAHTLGLAVQLATPRARLDEDDSDYDSDYVDQDGPPFYDLSNPCPPAC